MMPLLDAALVVLLLLLLLHRLLQTAECRLGIEQIDVTNARRYTIRNASEVILIRESKINHANVDDLTIKVTNYF